MQRVCITLLLLGLWSLPVSAQKATNLTQAIHYIKLANTLREVDKSQESISLLTRALPAVEGRNLYWTAVANELIGLSYNDLGDSKNALQYLTLARSQYTQLKYVASGWAVNEVIRDISGKNVYAGIQIGIQGVKLAIFKTKYESEFYDKDIKSIIDVPDVALVANASNSFRTGQNALKTCLDSIRKYDIPNERIFVVLSSEVRDGLARSPENKKQLYDQLSSLLPDGGMKIDTTLTLQREAELFTIGAIPRRVWPNTSALEIGTTSTMGGYFDQDPTRHSGGLENKTFHGITFPFGTNTIVNQIDAKKTSTMDTYRQEAQVIVKNLAGTALKTRFSAISSGLQQRKTVGLGGDIVWALVTYLHPEKAETAAVAISAADIEQFRRMALDDYKSLTHPALSAIGDAAVRKKAEQDVATIQDRLSEKQLIAGALWLEATTKTYASATPKRFVFIRDADISWVTGKFLETINNEYESTIAKGNLYTR